MRHDDDDDFSLIDKDDVNDALGVFLSNKFVRVFILRLLNLLRMAFTNSATTTTARREK